MNIVIKYTEDLEAWLSLGKFFFFYSNSSNLAAMDSNKTNNLTTSNLTAEALNIGTLTIIQVAFYTVIAIIGTAANLVLCGALLRRKHRSTSEDFILNLAVTDVMTCAVGIPLDMAVILVQHWPFGAFMCKVVYPFQTALIAIRVATLTCMAIERYRAIMTPFKPMLTARVAWAQHCRTNLAKRLHHYATSRNVAWKIWPFSNLRQQHLTCRSRVAKHTRPTMLRYVVLKCCVWPGL